MPIKEQRTPTPSRLFGKIILALGALFLITNFILPFVLCPQIPGTMAQSLNLL